MTPSLFPDILLVYLQVHPARIHKADFSLYDFEDCTQTSLLEDTFLLRYHLALRQMNQDPSWK